MKRYNLLNEDDLIKADIMKLSVYLVKIQILDVRQLTTINMVIGVVFVTTIHF